MSQKTVWLPEIGELIVSKRRGTKNIRLSITASGKVRVGLPAWAPYSAGINFARSRGAWINSHRDKIPQTTLRQGTRIGKSYRLNFIHQPAKSGTTTRVKTGSIEVVSGSTFDAPAVQKRAGAAAERALKQEAQKLLPQRLAAIALKHGFSYKSIRIKKLSSRWGSCSSDKAVTLNYYLMQLPWQLIDYVLLHELVHTRHLNHSRQFWADLERVYPGAKAARRQIKDYRPMLNHSGPAVA